MIFLKTLFSKQASEPIPYACSACPKEERERLFYLRDEFRKKPKEVK